MMIEAVGESAYVAGSSKDIVATGPIPGRTPMSVPTNTPTKHARRLPGARVTVKPYARLARRSTRRSEAPEPDGEVDAQPDLEDEVGHERGPQRAPRGHEPALALERHQEEEQQRERREQEAQ